MNYQGYISLADLGAVSTSDVGTNIKVLGVPPAGGSSLPGSALITFSDLKTAITADVSAAITQLQNKPGNGAFASPVTMTLTGQVTGSTSFDGSANFSLATTVPDGALATTAVNGLPSTLTSLQSQINAKADPLGFTPVQQGTGVGQLANTVKIGWSGSKLKATVDTSDQGNIAMESWVPSASVASAAAWTTARTISLTGDVSGSVTLDGTANVSLAATVGGLTGKLSTTPTSLGGSVDLNTLTTSGWYVQTLNSQAASGVNYPTGLAGLLEVSNGSGFVYQRYSVYNTGDTTGNRVFIRCFYSGTWGSWWQLARVNDSITGTAAGWTTARTLTLTGPVTGSVSWDGTGNASMATSFNSSSLAPANMALGTSAASTDLNAAQADVLMNWSPSALNSGSVDQYGTLLTVSSSGGAPAPVNGTWLNQLCFGTNGGLYWRYNVNAAGWNTVKLWHTGNFNPANYASLGSQPNFAGITVGGASTGPYIYESDSTNHSLGIRTGPSTAYRYFVFGYDGSFGTSGGIQAGGNVVAGNVTLSNSSQFRGIIPAGFIPTLTSSTTANPGYVGAGNGDGSSNTTCSMMIGSWNGVGFGPTISGQTIAIGTYSHWFDVRGGNMGMAGSLTANGNVNATAFTATAAVAYTGGKSGEGQVWLGNNDYYYFGNATNAGYYSSSAGYAYGWNMGGRTFTVYGTQNTQSDARCKTGFEVMDPRPLWRSLDMLSWRWKQSNLQGYGPKAQDVEKVAPEYVREDKDVPVISNLGGTKRQIENAKKRIAAGKERGMLAVDKTNLALEMGFAAGRLVDKLEKRVAQLERQLKAYRKKAA